MSPQKRMPRYDIRNDGLGPYAVFYCEMCDREFRSRPDVKRTVAKDVTRDAVGGFLRNIPIVGGAVADRATEDPRYTYDMDQQQLEAAWAQVEENFHECPTCLRMVCLSDWDTQSGFCNEDSPRRGEIAEAQAEQAVGVLKGIAGAFGLGAAIQGAAQAARAAQNLAHCPKDGTLAAAGTKFCPECGSPMVQPAAAPCPKCGTETQGAKFCPNCGTKMEQAAAPTTCPKCGADVRGAKFCPNCGTKVG